VDTQTLLKKMVFFHSIAYIGKNNEPLFFLANTEDEFRSIELQHIIHNSLDIIGEKKSRKYAYKETPTQFQISHSPAGIQYNFKLLHFAQTWYKYS